MNPERDRIFHAVAGALIVAAFVGLLLALLGGCIRVGGDGDGEGGPCDWFALAAAPAATKTSGTTTRKTEPSRPRVEDRPRTGAAPAPSASVSKRPAHRHGDDFDICDD
ncbi:hypothetical protein [Streptomyces sp. NBC_01233]|uniref:hypothetical protein n=1 Tax=Streptomyces sp. NBC_01233 TaxID=2903787 RepID=UPI002E120E50|nr:hypothetical protein OG332_24300 [Streptomyces sp. NBC_01233]